MQHKHLQAFVPDANSQLPAQYVRAVQNWIDNGTTNLEAINTTAFNLYTRKLVDGNITVNLSAFDVNDNYKSIPIKSTHDFSIWGVVKHALKQF